MKTRRSSMLRRLAVVAAGVLGWGVVCCACNVPVFRYALENWQPDEYQVLILARGPLDDSQQAVVSQLEAAASDPTHPANVRVHAIDLQAERLSEALAQRLGEQAIPQPNLVRLDEWAAELPLDEPMMFVFYPRTWDRIAWQASVTAENAARLVDSPLRQEIARRLLDGQSAVWVLLECGDDARDEAAWEKLNQDLAHASTVVELPPRELIQADEFYRPDVQIELRVEFSAVRLRADDPAEQAFASLLRGSEEDLREFDDPIAVPLYGRGRTHFALVGEGINGTTIQENGQFLCGACSCQVKEDNPGLDMLMAINWAELVQGTAMPPIVLPELTGIGGLEAAQAAANVSAPGDATVPTEPAAPAESPSADSAAAGATPPTTASASTSSAPTPVAAGRPADRLAPDLTAAPFSKRLLLGISGGALAALLVVAMATICMRRTF